MWNAKLFHIIVSGNPQIDLILYLFYAVRKDRESHAHGGVFIAFKRGLFCTETPELGTNCEIVWCRMNIIG